MDALSLPPDLARALDDLADATGLRPEDIVRDAVRDRLRAEEARVLGEAERLAQAHADLLRRLGE
ncbi:ribbon-helix-helix protein, CopG family [Streptomyces sp. NPDC021608]|uniref:ribbon-helix-helix protein, CopG family n=1 Tax=Streptomyces sp. NPDC021608 TaxID=3154903 RepID=UPI0033DA9765